MKSRLRRLAAFLLPVLVFVPPAIRADFGIEYAEPTVQNRVIHVNTRFNLSLNPRTEEALTKGIPIDVIFDIRLVRHRWWWANHDITDISLRRSIWFHALSRRYLVSGLNERNSAESFATLPRALAHLGNFENFTMTIAPKKYIDPGARHLLQMRARLDIEALPTLMRPLAYATPSWRLNTGWKEWIVTP